MKIKNDEFMINSKTLIILEIIAIVTIVTSLICGIFLIIDFYSASEDMKKELKEMQSKYPHIRWDLMK
jgi:hypothetical protein